MSLIVALRGIDGLVLAADSRGTIGDPRALTAINDTHIKLFELSSCCGIGIAGASELAATIVDELRSVIKAENLKFADDILHKTRELVRARYDDWFIKFELNSRPVITFIITGFQDQEGERIPRTYLLSSQLDFAPQLVSNGNMLAGVPQYAIYLMHRLYNPDMTIADLARLAAYLIAETATQDPKVGGPIRIAKMTQEAGFQEFGEEEIAEIIKRNNEQNEELRQFFFGGGNLDTTK